ncbi:MAG TPA: NAD(P)-dependent oxidoreductase [Ignavibacteria bacterium]
MKALVTGGTGFVGSHLTEKLLEKGWEVKCLTRKTSNLRWLKNLNVEIICGSFFDDNSLKKAVEDVDYIFHIAGAVMSKTTQGYFISNQIATKNLAEASIKYNKSLKRFIYLSSQTVYGPSLNGEPTKETDDCKPITTYGKSKLAAEKELLNLAEELPLTIIRPPAIYGPRDEAIYQYFLAVSKGLISLIGFSDKFISIIHSHDLINGIMLAAENENAIGEIYNISSEKYYSWKDIGDICKKAIGRKTITIRLPHFLVYTVAAFSQLFGYLTTKGAVFNIEKARDFTQKYWILSPEKAIKQLGFKQEVSLEDGIKSTIEWYKQNGWMK